MGSGGLAAEGRAGLVMLTRKAPSERGSSADGDGGSRIAVSFRCVIVASGLVAIVLAGGCSVDVPGGSSIYGETEPITRPELLLALGAMANSLEGASAGLVGRQRALNACIEFPRLLIRERNNAEGILLMAEDLPRLHLAEGQCAEKPGLAASLIRSVLYETRPREGVKEARCQTEEVELRFAKHGVNSSGEVYLRLELVSRASDLCAIDGPLSAQLVQADSQVLDADPRGSDSRYRTLPGPGTVQWFRVGYTATKAYCTGNLVSVKEIRVRFPNDGGTRTLAATTLPIAARTYCPDTLPELVEDPEVDLKDP